MKLTLWRIGMDEVEFGRAYNDAVTAAERVAAPETQKALMLILQLVSALREQVAELQMSEDC